MCGIIGFSSKGYFDPLKIKFLLYWNAMERGRDSTGVFTPLSGIVKDAEEASVFINDKKNNVLPDKLLIGHTRWKTVGNVTKKNAHPFDHDGLIGVHNGGISNIWTLLRNRDLKSSDFDVDSDGLFAILSKDNNPSVLSEIDGAAAIAFVDNLRNPGTLYCFRNKERPLFRGKINNSMYISSIEESLEAIGCTKIEEFKENYLYTIIDGEIKHTLKIKPYEKPKEESRNYFPALNKKTDYKQFDPKELVGKWVQADTSCKLSWGKECNIVKDNFYFITGLDGDDSGWKVNVIDEDDNHVICAKYIFRYHSVSYDKDEWVIAVVDIHREHTNEIIIPEGELMQISKVENDGIFTTVAKTSYRIPYRMFRKLKDYELEQGSETPFKEDKNKKPLSQNEFVEEAIEEDIKSDKEEKEEAELLSHQDLSIAMNDIFKQASDVRALYDMNIDANKDFNRLETMIVELSEKIEKSVIIG